MMDSCVGAAMGCMCIVCDLNAVTKELDYWKGAHLEASTAFTDEILALRTQRDALAAENEQLRGQEHLTSEMLRDAKAENARLIEIVSSVANDLESGVEDRRGAYLRLLAEVHKPDLSRIATLGQPSKDSHEP